MTLVLRVSDKLNSSKSSSSPTSWRFFITDTLRLAVSYLGSKKTERRTDALLASEDEAETRDTDMRFSSITGVVSTEEKVRVEHMIFRATHGNCYVRFAPIK